jgi:hypothetical protein
MAYKHPPMRVMRALFLSALGMVTGCGGCDSCFGKAQPGDFDAAAPTTSTVTPATADAATGPRVEAADAASDAPTTEPPSAAVPRASGLPRPKAPMPTGAYQACGVYDGPLCEKTCKKGACRQECEGVECLLTCEGGYCSQLCQGNAKCRMTCVGGHCIQSCTKPEGCIKECAGGSCE